MNMPPKRRRHTAVDMLLSAASTVELDLANNERRADQNSLMNGYILRNGTHENHNSQQRRTGVHRCPVCHRTYERADHLSRHLKSHENARPFQCQSCMKSFNRLDLLHRHVATHVRHASSGTPYIRRTGRATQACFACAAAKVQCEDKKPCKRCRTRNVKCEAATQQSYLQEEADTAIANETRKSQDSIEESIVLKTRPITPTHTTSTTLNDGDENYVPQNSFTSPHTAGDIPQNISNVNFAAVAQENNEHAEIFHANGSDYTMINPPLHENQIDFNTAVDEMLFFFPPTDFNNQNLDFGFNDFNFQDESLIISSATQKYVTVDDAANTKAARKPQRTGRDISRGHAAFTRSPWLWTPASKDHILTDQGSLDLDKECIPSNLTPPSSGARSDPEYGGSLSIGIGLRDKMFYLVSTMNKYYRGIPTFPSLDILNSIIESFFVRQSYQIDAYVHLPTISTTDIQPEFLIALVAGGSKVISVPAIWKMGLALLDVVRVTVGELWEKENSNTRKLQPLQAWMLFLDTGLWSGFQRQMELAESFGQPMITIKMMRRGGIFAAPPDTGGLIPEESDTGQVLESKWRTWAQRESFKRLSLHLFLHDSRASISLQKQPLISLTELSFSVPSSSTNFLASSAEDWKAHYLKLNCSPRRSLPRLVDCMRDLHFLDDFSEESDVNLCYMALLHGFWNQIWAFREACKFHGVGDSLDSAHSLWLATQQRELYRDMCLFKDKLTGMTNTQQEFILTAELLLMLLHVSAEELQRFAGKSGEEAAAQSLVSLERWSRTEQARRAVWHAGQVFRWALSMPPAELRDFYTIAVYFASLTMWTYGHLSSAAARDAPQRSKNGQPISDNSPSVALNGPESLETQAFTLKGLGKPGLTQMVPLTMDGRPGTVQGTFVALSEPHSALNMACDLYRSNFPVLEEPLPPLVENIGKLMRELCSLAESRFSRCASPVER